MMRRWGSLGRASIAAWLTVLSFATLAGSPNDVRVSGMILVADPNGGSFRITFTCFGMPTCSGIYAAIARDSGCSNSISISDMAVLSGIDLSRPGTIQGTIVVQGSTTHSTLNPDGTCTYGISTGSNTLPYTGTWDGTNGVFTISVTNSYTRQVFTASGTFTAAIPTAPPVFPMTVTPNITPTTATATAQIQPRAQDVGATASVFVFAHAPASLLAKSTISKRVSSEPIVAAEPQDAPDPCVLAQVGSGGQLVGVSASTMQAYTTGVLSAQGQAVTILNNVSTPSVAGANFFVGYGANAGAMLANGIYQSALSIPGSSQCTASLASAPAPNSPGTLSGLWWNSTESGWGISFTQRRNILFAAWYTYDASGNPKWYVASACAMPAGTTGTSGTCNGVLYEAANGPTFFGTPFNPSLVHALTVGSLQVNFQDANNASMTYTAAGQTRTVAITRQIFQIGPTPTAVDYTDLWWNPSESGWGIAVTQQYGVMFLTWFVYDNSGKPTWYAATSCTVSGASCSGKLYRATGPAFGPAFDALQVHAIEAGTVTLSFSDANHATLTYTVNGVAATKAIARQLF